MIHEREGIGRRTCETHQDPASFMPKLFEVPDLDGVPLRHGVTQRDLTITGKGDAAISAD
jgi:hypothetical protein